MRALDVKYSTNEAILNEFYDVETIKMSSAANVKKLIGAVSVEAVVDPKTNEEFLEMGAVFTDTVVAAIKKSNIKTVKAILNITEMSPLLSLKDDVTNDHDSEGDTAGHEAAVMKIYSRFRPGSPNQVDRAIQHFKERFFDDTKYRLGKVGRFRINRKFEQNVPESEMVLRVEDYVNTVKYLLSLRTAKGEKDDIDHLGNRRLRTIDELAGDEFRKGFLKLKRTVQERMINIKEEKDLTPKNLVITKTVSSAIEYFFARSELSQVVDQTNPLAQLNHERCLSALGPVWS